MRCCDKIIIIINNNIIIIYLIIIMIRATIRSSTVVCLVSLESSKAGKPSPVGLSRVCASVAYEYYNNYK
jgi:hypothetical protein